MAIFYKVIERKDPRNLDGPGKFYASNVSFGVIETEKLAENIAARSGHSVGQLVGLFQDYFRRIENYVVAGKTVSMAPLGTIIPAFNGLGSDTEKNYDPEFITKMKLNFRMSPSFRLKMQPANGMGGEVELRKWGE